MVIFCTPSLPKETHAVSRAPPVGRIRENFRNEQVLADYGWRPQRQTLRCAIAETPHWGVFIDLILPSTCSCPVFNRRAKENFAAPAGILTAHTLRCLRVRQFDHRRRE